MWRLVHQWSFLLFWLSFDCFWLFLRLVHCTTIGVAIVTGLPRLYQHCTNRQKQSKTVKRQSKQQKWLLVYQSSRVYQDCTNSVPIIKNSQKLSKIKKKQSKDSQNSKNYHMSHRVRRIHKAYLLDVHDVHRRLKYYSVLTPLRTTRADVNYTVSH